MATAMVAATLTLVTAPPASAGPQILGSGSTWSANAVQQWVADVSRFGINVVFQANGSSAGRQQFIVGQTDFAVSEIPFQGPPFDNETDRLNASGMGYSYLPIVAGGTSFMYNIPGVTDLKLTQKDIARLFTGDVAFWDDPSIVASTGHPLPHLAVRPITRADGSGTSAQLSLFLQHQPDTRQAFGSFLAANNYPTDGRPVQVWPPVNNGQAVSGSEGLADLVNRTSGAVGYVETSYAIQRNKPVAFMQNQSGNYALPTAANVAIALGAARLNADRSQNLDGVYTNADPNTYPLSSYSYMIVRTDPAHLSADKGKDIANFIYYAVCAGQQKAVGNSGYSPLPKNLVQAAFDGARQQPGADPPPDINGCKNPTITGQFVRGQGGSSTPPPSGGGSGGSGGGSGGSGSGSSGSGSGASGSSDAAATEVAAGAVDEFGDPISGSGAETATVGQAANVRVDGSLGSTWVLIFAAVALIGLVLVPSGYAALSGRGAARDAYDEAKSTALRRAPGKSGASGSALSRPD